MRTLIVKIKSRLEAQVLAEFLRTIEYVASVELSTLDRAMFEYGAAKGMVPGDYNPGEKPSDYIGIWKRRKKVDAGKLRKRAWKRDK